MVAKKPEVIDFSTCQIHLELKVVHNDGMVNAATFQKEVQATLKIVQVPPQLRRLEFARTTASGDMQPLQ